MFFFIIDLRLGAWEKIRGLIIYCMYPNIGYSQTPLLERFLDICFEKKDEMISRMNIIIFICRNTCASSISSFRESVSELGCYMGSELGL